MTATSIFKGGSPELAGFEDGIATPTYTQNRQHPVASTTSVDILQIQGAPQETVSWAENLGHDDLVHHFGVSLKYLQRRKLGSLVTMTLYSIMMKGRCKLMNHRYAYCEFVSRPHQ